MAFKSHKGILGENLDYYTPETEATVEGQQQQQPTETGEPNTEPTEVVNVEPVVEPTVEAEVVVEPTVEPTETTTLEPIVSVKPTPEVITEQPTKYGEDDALSYLSEKLGREIKSLDDLKPRELSPDIEKIIEWQERTKRDIKDYSKYSKDYDKVSDVGVAREHLAEMYPTLDASELDLEMSKFIGDSDLDSDSEIKIKALNLKKFAQEGRTKLNADRLVFDTPIDVSKNLPLELQNDITLGRQYKEDIETSKLSGKQYQEGITKAINTTESIQLNLAEGVSIKYNLSDEAKRNLPQQMNEMKHWKNEDGSWNHQAVVNDGIKVKHFDAAVAAAYNQGLSAGKEAVIDDVTNSNINNPTQASTQGETPKTDLPEIEGRERMMGIKSRSRFRKR